MHRLKAVAYSRDMLSHLERSLLISLTIGYHGRRERISGKLLKEKKGGWLRGEALNL